MTQAKGYVDPRYLQATAQLFQPIKQYSYTLMRIGKGNTVLDVGSGAGIDTVTLAKLVGPTGHVLGIDSDAAMVAEANKRAKQHEVDAFVEHRQGAATALPIESETIDACRSERLLMHLPDADKALAEMVRVTKSGGWIVVVEPDWGTVSIDTQKPQIERRLMRVQAEITLHNGYAGRQLYGLFKRCDLASISIKMFPIYCTEYALARYIARLDEVEKDAIDAGVVTPEDLQRWHSSLEQADKEGVFFASTCLIMVSGRKS